MIERFAADGIVILHLGFILFVGLGGLLSLRWPRAACLHLPAVLWGAAIELRHGICPLTPLELKLRAAAGEAGYSGGFIEHYLIPIIYPSGMDEQGQAALGALVVVINLGVYGWVLFRRHRHGPARLESGSAGKD